MHRFVKNFVIVLFLNFTGGLLHAQNTAVHSFSPSSGPVGTIVTINGSGFATSAASNVVYLGELKAEILTSTSNQLTALVPIGASSVAPVTVTNLITQKTGSSQTALHPFFHVTYPGGKISRNSYTQSNWEVGDAPFSMVSGDFNNDGRMDIATANYGTSTVSVLIRNNTNTGFNTKVDFNVGSIPRTIAAADFNGDGKLDLATGAHGPTGRTISVLIRNSNPIESGGFTLAPTVTANLELSAIAVGDVNGDGRPDLISANYNNNNVSVFVRNNTNDGFLHSGNYAVGTSVTNIASGDFNGDGKMDIVASNYASNNVSVLIRNSTNNGFNAAVNYFVGTSPRGVAVADFNSDGRMDLAVGNHNSFSVAILLRNAANNGFAPVATYPLPIYAQWVVVGDFNGDGKSDVAINGFQQTSATGNNVFVLVNNGNGTFQNPNGFFVDGAIRVISSGDYNGDGMADLAAANYNGSNVSLWASNLSMWQGVTSNWHDPQNWWSRKVPTVESEIVVKGCTTCPILKEMLQGRRLWIENSTLGSEGAIIKIDEDATVQTSTFKGDVVLELGDLLEFFNNTFEGNLLLKKTGGIDNYWKGGNRYKAALRIINNSDKSIVTATHTINVIRK